MSSLLVFLPFVVIAAVVLYLRHENRRPIRAIYQAHPEYTYRNLQRIVDEAERSGEDASTAPEESEQVA